MLKQLPNGLPTYKLMHLKTTDEKCQIVKINDAILNDEKQIIFPLTVNVKVTRVHLNIPYTVIIERVSPYDLEVWNEAMNPKRRVEYRTPRRKEVRVIFYNRTM